MTDLQFAGYVKPAAEGEPFDERQLIDVGFAHELSHVRRTAASVALWRGPACEGYPYGYQAAVAYDSVGVEAGRAYVALDESGEPQPQGRPTTAGQPRWTEFERVRKLPDTPDPEHDTVVGEWWRAAATAAYQSKGGGATTTDEQAGFSDDELARGVALRLWHPHYSSSLSSFIYYYWELFDRDGAKIGEKMHAEDIRD
jgi:hypothetical protein